MSGNFLKKTVRIKVPLALQNLQASQQLAQTRSVSRVFQQELKNTQLVQTQRSLSQLVRKPPKLPPDNVDLNSMKQDALDVSIAIRLLPVDYYYQTVHDQNQFINNVQQVDSVVDTILNPSSELISGSGMTQYWMKASDPNSQRWVNCEVLSKIDGDKFLVFINEFTCNKVVSTSNIIFTEVVLQTEREQQGQDDQERQNLPTITNVREQLGYVSDDFLIEIFKKQQYNTRLKKQFAQAVEQFARLSVQKTEQQFKHTESMCQFSVQVLQNDQISHINKNAALLIKLQDTRLKRAQEIQQKVVEQITANLSSSVILASESIQKINFEKINANLEGFHFNQIKESNCDDFLQHAQLCDSQLQVLQEAFNDEKHQLHWCCHFLSNFLWSSYRLFKQYSNYYYCFGITSLDTTGIQILDQSKKYFKNNQKLVHVKLNKLQDKKFQALSNIINRAFEDHIEDIMFSATHFIKIAWSDYKPQIKDYISENFLQHYSENGIGNSFLTFITRMQFQQQQGYHIKSNSSIASRASLCVSMQTSASDDENASNVESQQQSAEINQAQPKKKKLDKNKSLTFQQTFLEKLINSHKVIYQFIAPYLVDQITSEFANSVMSMLNKKLHEYQAVHGITAPQQIRAQMADQCYQVCSLQFFHLFKIMEIKYFTYFINSLYESALPQWFYFLLALVHGGTKRKQIGISNRPFQSELIKIIHITPNTQSYLSTLEKDISSLNKYSDFKLIFEPSLVQKVLDQMSFVEFKIFPIVKDGIISSIKMIPDPMTIGQQIESCADELLIYYCSSPRLVDVLIYKFKEQQEYSQSMSVSQKEQVMDFYSLDYKKYLEGIYRGAQLTDQAFRNSFGLNFKESPLIIEQENIQVVEDDDDKQHKFHQHITDQDFKEQNYSENKMAEVIYYEPSILLTKFQKLSKIASTSFNKYFEVFNKYFELAIQKCQQFKNNLTDPKTLFPEQALKYKNQNYFEALSQSLETNKRNVEIKWKDQNQFKDEDKIRALVKIYNDSICNKTIVQQLTSEYKLGEGPSNVMFEIIEKHMQPVLVALKFIYEDSYTVQSLPNVCYYSTFTINMQTLLKYLIDLDKLLFELYSNRLLEYTKLISIVLDENLEQISSKLTQIYFNSPQEIGELYSIHKQFTTNKSQWLLFFDKLSQTIEQYEQFPLNNRQHSLSTLFYQQINTTYLKLHKKFRQVYLSMDSVVLRLVQAFNQTSNFLNTVQGWLETLISDIYQRVKEYLSIDYFSLTECEQNSLTFKRTYPLLVSSLVFPKIIKTEEYSQVDLKKLVKEIENKSSLPIFRASNLKLRIYDRIQLFKMSNVLDCFLELEDTISHIIETLNFLNDMQIQLVGQLDIEQFNDLDIALFTTLQKRNNHINQFKNKGNQIDICKQNVLGILNNQMFGNSTILSRLTALQSVFTLSTQLITIFCSFETNYNNWLTQPLAQVFLEDIKAQLFEAIRVCTKILLTFQETIKLTSIAENLIEFISNNRGEIQLIFFMKQAIYDSNILQTTQTNDTISRSIIDQLLKMDASDYAIHASYIIQLCHGKLKIADDVSTINYLEFAQQFDQSIFNQFRFSVQRIRSDRLQTYQTQNLNKLLSIVVVPPSNPLVKDIDDYKAMVQYNYNLSEEFLLPGDINVNSHKTLKFLENLDDTFIIGRQFQEISQNYSVYKIKIAKFDYFYSSGITRIVKSSIVDNEFDHQVLNYVNKQLKAVMNFTLQQDISSYLSQQTINTLCIIKEVTQIFWQAYLFASQISIVQSIVDQQKDNNLNIQLVKFNQVDTDHFNVEIRNMRLLLMNVFTSSSNILQIGSKKGLREQIFDMMQDFLKLNRQQFIFNFSFFRRLNYLQSDYQISLFTDLIYYDKFCKPQILDKGPHFDGSIIVQVPNDINATLSTVLQQLGYTDCIFNILQFLGRTEQGNPYNFYYIDGLITANGSYFKFVYPLIYDSLADIYLSLTRITLNAVIQATLQVHMLYWGKLVQSSADLDFFVILTQYPANIAFYIISQIIMASINSIYTYNSQQELTNNIDFLQKTLDILMQILENERDESYSPSEEDFDASVLQAQQSMLTSFENYFFFNEQSLIDNYPVYEKNLQRSDQFSQEQSSYHSSEENKNVNNNVDVDVDGIDSDEQDSEVGSDANVVQQKRGCLSEGFNVDDFAILSQLFVTTKVAIGTEQILIIVYMKTIIQQLISSVQSNTAFINFALPFCNSNLDVLLQKITEYIERQQDIFDGHAKQTQMINTEGIDIWVQGGLKMKSYNYYVTTCLCNAQVIEIVQLLINFLVPKMINIISTKQQLVLISPYCDNLQQPVVKCLVFDFIGFILQASVHQINLEQPDAIDQLYSANKSGCIIFLYNHLSMNQQDLPKLTQCYYDGIQYGTIYIHFLPELLHSQLDNCSLLSADANFILSSINIPFDSQCIFRITQMWHSECCYVKFVKLAAKYGRNFIVHQSVLNIIFGNQNSSFEYQLAFLMQHLIQTYQETDEDYEEKLMELLEISFSDQLEEHNCSLDKIMMIVEEKLINLFEFFPIMQEVQYGEQQPELETDIATQIDVPEQVSSFININQSLLLHTNLTQHAWDKIFDIILLICETQLESVSIVTEFKPDILLEIINVFTNIFTNIIQMPIQCINGVHNFQFYASNQIQSLASVLYIINYTQSSNQSYKLLIKEFLQMARKNSSYCILLTDDLELAMFTQHHFIINPINLYYNLCLIDFSIATIKQPIIMDNDEQILNRDCSKLNPIDINQVLSNFYIRPYQRNYISKIIEFVKLIIRTNFQLLSTLFVEVNYDSIYLILLCQLQLLGIVDVSYQLENEIVQFQGLNLSFNTDFLAFMVVIYKTKFIKMFADIQVLVGLSIFNSFSMFIQSQGNFNFKQSKDLLVENYQKYYEIICLNKGKTHEHITSVNEFLKINDLNSLDYHQHMIEIIFTPSQFKSNIKPFMFQFPIFSEIMKKFSYKDLLSLRQSYTQFHFGKTSYQSINIYNSQVISIYDIVPSYMDEIKDIIKDQIHKNSSTFLTDLECATRLQFMFSQFGEQFELNPSNQLRNVGFVVFSLIIFRQIVFLQGNHLAIYNNALTWLNEHFKTFPTVAVQLSNTPVRSYRQVNYTLLNITDIQHLIIHIRPFLSIIENQAFFNIFTILRLTIQQNVYDDEMFRFLLNMNVQICDECGGLNQFQLINCSFVISIITNSVDQDIEVDYYGHSSVYADSQQVDTVAQVILKICKGQDLHSVFQLPYKRLLYCQPAVNQLADVLMSKMQLMLNQSIYKNYYSKILFYLFQDLFRVVYISRQKDTIDKFKFDAGLKADFSQQLLDESENYLQLSEYYQTPVIPYCPVFNLVQTNSLSYQSFVHYFMKVTQSLPTITNDYSLSDTVPGTILMDIGNIIGTEYTLNSKSPVPSEFYYLTSQRDKVLFLLNAAILSVFNMQRYSQIHQKLNSPANQDGKDISDILPISQPFLDYSLFDKKHKLFPCHITNVYMQSIAFQFTNLDVCRFSSKNQATQMFVIIPLSLLISTNLLRALIDFVVPGNAITEIFTPHDIADIQSEACIFTNSDTINIHLIREFFFQKIQLYIYQDVHNIDISSLSPYIEVFSLNSTQEDYLVWNQQIYQQFSDTQMKFILISFKQFNNSKLNLILSKILYNLQPQTVVCKQTLYIVSYFIQQQISNMCDIKMQSLIDILSKIKQSLKLCDEQSIIVQKQRDALQDEITHQRKLQDAIDKENNQFNDYQQQMDKVKDESSATFEKYNRLNQMYDSSYKQFIQQTFLKQLEFNQITQADYSRFLKTTEKQAAVFLLQLTSIIIYHKEYPNFVQNEVAAPSSSQTGQYFEQFTNRGFAKDSDWLKDLTNFDIKTLSEQQTQLVKCVCKHDIFIGYSFYDDVIKALFNFYTVLISGYESIDFKLKVQIKELQTNIDSIESAFSGLQELQRTSKQHSTDFQKQLDTISQRVDTYRDNLNQQVNISEQAQILNQFITNNHNDFIYDQYNLQQEKNLSCFTAAIVAVAILTNIETAVSIQQKIVKRDQDICCACSADTICRRCTRCQCLCICIFDYDGDVQLLFNRKATVFSVNNYVHSKDGILSQIQKVNTVYLTKRPIIEYTLNVSSAEQLEIQSVLLLQQCVFSKFIQLSLINANKIIQMLDQQCGLFVFEINTKGQNQKQIIQSILSFFSKDFNCLILRADQLTLPLFQICYQLCQFFENCSNDGCPDYIIFQRDRIKITKQYRLFLVLDQLDDEIELHATQKYIIRTDGFLRNISNNFIPIATINTQYDIQKSIQWSKQSIFSSILQFYNIDYLNQLCEQKLQLISLSNSQENSIQLLNNQLKALKIDLLHIQLNQVIQTINQYQNILSQTTKLKQDMRLIQDEMSSDQTNTSSWLGKLYNLYFIIIQYITKFSVSYPLLIQLTNQVLLFNKSLIPTTSEELVQLKRISFIPNKSSYNGIIYNLAYLMKNSFHSDFVIQFLVQIIILSEYSFGNIDVKTIQFIREVFALRPKKTKKIISNILQKDETNNILQDINLWSERYPQEFDLIFQQPNPCQYLKSYYKKELLPGCWQNLSTCNGLYVMCIAYLIQNRSATEIAKQFLYANFVEKLLFLNDSDIYQQITAEKDKQCIFLTQNVTQLVYILLKQFGQMQFAKVEDTLDFKANSIIIISLAQLDNQLLHKIKKSTNCVVVCAYQCQAVQEEQLELLFQNNTINFVMIDTFPFRIEQQKSLIKHMYKNKLRTVKEMLYPLMQQTYNLDGISFDYLHFQDIFVGMIVGSALCNVAQQQLATESTLSTIQLVLSRFEYMMSLNGTLESYRAQNYLRNCMKLITAAAPQQLKLIPLSASYNQLNYIQNFTELEIATQLLFNLLGQLEPIADGLVVAVSAFAVQSEYVQAHPGEFEMALEYFMKDDRFIVPHQRFIEEILRFGVLSLRPEVLKYEGQFAIQGEVRHGLFDVVVVENQLLQPQENMFCLDNLLKLLNEQPDAQIICVSQQKPKGGQQCLFARHFNDVVFIFVAAQADFQYRHPILLDIVGTRIEGKANFAPVAVVTPFF